jgi:Ca2+-transporting ATPase
MKPAIVLLEPTNLLLLSCALIYGLIGEPAEAAILLAFVVGISLLDAIQQQRSNRALAELARLSAPLAHVRRDGVDLAIAAEQLRLGDLLRLEEGDRVAADASLTETVGLWLDESLLTGESLPVAKQGGDWIRAGSLVASGRGWAEVKALAEATELGQIGRSLATVTPPPTRLQRHTRRLTLRLTLLALGLCALLAVGQGGIGGNWPQALLAALALALALLPNEIPVVLALFLALGALRLARIGVLARWPAAVESLGSATVLAVDKTGTLTENRMGVQRLITWPEQLSWQPGSALEEPFHQLLEMAVLASRGDPVDAMELAIQRLALDQLSGSEHLHPDWPLEREYPLQTNLLVFSQLWGDGRGNWQLAAKGAPEAIADLCHLDPQAAGQLIAAADQLAAEGLRVLAVASGIDGVVLHDGQPASLQPEPAAGPHDYVFQPLGLIGLADPLRAEVHGAIATARGAGVRIVMVTGDSPVTARSIADQAGLPPGPVVSGAQLEGLSAQALAALCPQVCVFARVMPQQKLQLVQALQASGEVVAMTGDGVNDAPALKAADIGVAMGKRGTAVARESADLVLLEDSFSALVQALAIGRRIDDNLHRALGYTLAIHLPIASLSLLPLLLPGQPLILLPVHIALLHLVIDPASTVVFEALPAIPELMRRPPRPPQAPLFATATWQRALGQGTLLNLGALALSFWPGISTESHRSLVFSYLLLVGGGLVWISGDPPSWLTARGAAIGFGMWLLLLAIPPDWKFLGTEPMRPGKIGLVLITTLIALTLTHLLGRSLKRKESS